MTWTFVVLALMRLLARRSGRVSAAALALAKGPILAALGDGAAPAFAAPDEFKKSLRDMLNALAGTINRPLVKLVLTSVIIPLVTDELLDLLWRQLFEKKDVVFAAGPGDELVDAAVSELMCA